MSNTFVISKRKGTTSKYKLTNDNIMVKVSLDFFLPYADEVLTSKFVGVYSSVNTE